MPSPRSGRCSSAWRSSSARSPAATTTCSVHASLIEGGQELSSYPERCVLAIERRTIPGDGAEQLDAELARLIAVGDAGPASSASTSPGAELTGRTTLVRPPFEVSPHEHIVALLR